MSALTQRTSGRLALLIMAGAIVVLLLASLMVSGASAETVTIWPDGIPLADSDSVCEAQGYGPAYRDFVIPRGDAVPRFDETFVDSEVTVRLTAPPNRSRVNFTVTGAKVFGAFLYNRTDGTGGVTEHNFEPEGTSQGTLVPPSRDNGNEKLAVLCLGKATPTISTLATSSGVINEAFYDVATVSGGDSPSGDVSFEVYLDSCDTTPISVGTSSLDGATATSPMYVPETAGTVYWVATYNGDDNNNEVSGTCGDEGETSIVYEFNAKCGIPITQDDPATGTIGTFLRPEGSPGCNEENNPEDDSDKFGNINFFVSDGTPGVELALSGEGETAAKFVGEVTFDTSGLTSIPIIKIDDDENGSDNFRPMEWWVGSAPVLEFDSGGAFIDATFTCPTLEVWCILEAQIQRDATTWKIGGLGVDPKWSL